MKKAETQKVEKQEPKHAVILNEEVMKTVSSIIGEIPTKYGLSLIEIFNANTFEVQNQEKAG